MHKLVGAGLPNVYLLGGVIIEGDDDDQTIAYAHLDGLYKEISRAIAFRPGAMSGLEFRFLRKRLGLSQAEAARFGGKTEQAVAKWEKELTPVPTAEARLLRLATLSRFGTKEEMSRVVSQLTSAAPKLSHHRYVIRYEQGVWKQDEAEAIEFATTHDASQASRFEYSEPLTSATMLESAPYGNTVLAGHLVESVLFQHRSESARLSIVRAQLPHFVAHTPIVNL